MEKELNIAAILKDKPQNTRLWSPIFGDVYLKDVTDVNNNMIRITHHGVDNIFMNNGKVWADGDVCLFPSRWMNDWQKFAWKKGDVLVSNDGKQECIFDGWYNKDYTQARVKYWLDTSNENNIKCLEENQPLTSVMFKQEDKEKIESYINTVEERLGGKLNLKTLEIEKQPKFKDGDIVCISGMGYLAYGIVKSINNSSKKLEYYVLNDMSTLKFEDWLSFEDKQIQPITETQQIILFEALAKKGKRWNAENKQIEDLFKKYEFKPMDWCLMKDSTKYWELCQFAYTRKVHGTTIYSAVGGLIYYKCIPYNEETKHLLGTTDEWKGGK